jgi:hypothetical protein
MTKVINLERTPSTSNVAWNGTWELHMDEQNNNYALYDNDGKQGHRATFHHFNKKMAMDILKWHEDGERQKLENECSKISCFIPGEDNF